MDSQVIDLLKKIETQVEYLRNIENLLERVVHATEGIRKNTEVLSGSMQNVEQKTIDPNQPKKGPFGF